MTCWIGLTRQNVQARSPAAPPLRLSIDTVQTYSDSLVSFRHAISVRKISCVLGELRRKTGLILRSPEHGTGPSRIPTHPICSRSRTKLSSRSTHRASPTNISVIPLFHPLLAPVLVAAVLGVCSRNRSFACGRLGACAEAAMGNFAQGTPERVFAPHLMGVRAGSFVGSWPFQNLAVCGSG